MKKRSLAEYWLWLGVAAVAAAGLYALVPVIGRTPQLKDLAVVQQLFDVALVIHVDLSVMVWFFAMICLGASQIMTRAATPIPYWGKAGLLTMALATLLMATSPLGAWEPLKSNYIPVLHNGLFLTSLGLLFAGVLVSLLPVVATHALPKNLRQLNVIELGFVTSAQVVILGLIGYVLAARVLPDGLELTEHYERLFWAGGHIMQFAYVLLAMAAWLMLLEALGGVLPTRKLAGACYVLAVLGALMSLGGFAHHAFDSGEFSYFQTRTMIEWGGVGATVMAVAVLRSLVKAPIAKSTRAYAAALIVSLILFFSGGVLGLMISGQNVTIPAHYHGMITGITQALMGMACVILPRFGYQSIAHTRLAFWQPIIYGLGQLMHIGGLAYCGGYGILRKTAGGFEHLAPDIKIALGIFGLGGLLAITGGILFVVVMLKARR